MKNKFLKFCVLLTLAASVTAFTGCGSSKEAAPDAGAAAEEAEEAAPEADAAAEEAASSDYGESEIYTPEDMEKAVEAIMKEFDNWKGCKMNEIKYAGDECASDVNLESVKEAANGKEFTQCIEFISSFHSPTDEADLEGTAWEPDTEYTDYQWWLGRTDGGEWELVNWGY